MDEQSKNGPTSGNAAPNPARANGPAKLAADCAARARLVAELEAVTLELEDMARRGVPDTLARKARSTLERLKAEANAACAPAPNGARTNPAPAGANGKATSSAGNPGTENPETPTSAEPASQRPAVAG